MRYNRQRLLTLAVVIPIWGCGSGGGGTDATPVTGSPAPAVSTEVTTETGSEVNTTVLTNMLNHFQVTSSMDAEILKFIRYDFGTLAGWTDTTRTQAFAQLANLYGITDVNSSTLSQWLMERITYIYPDDGKNLQFAFIVPAENRVYQASVKTASGEGVAASNVGGGLYSIYLDQHRSGVDGMLLNFNQTYVPFLSPRTGVMQIGPNFFDQTDSLDTSNIARRGFRTVKSLYRLSVLFHEARHSDGNLQAGTLSFAHLICPVSEKIADEYVGLPACDEKANGAYNIGAQILTAMEGICDSICSQRELSIIEAIHLDVLSRLLIDDTVANYGDPSPETSLRPIDTRTYQIVPEQ
ncbi:MAG: hypothetical protein EOP10_01335 [Proteobacteria bacterium]|nr:MAG: hypothetical protein EOP10_01335 [Pseudomonadota bacterium]